MQVLAVSGAPNHVLVAALVPSHITKDGCLGWPVATIALCAHVRYWTLAGLFLKAICILRPCIRVLCETCIVGAVSRARINGDHFLRLLIVWDTGPLSSMCQNYRWDCTYCFATNDCYIRCAYGQQQNAVCAKRGEPFPLPQGAQVSCQQCCRQNAPQITTQVRHTPAAADLPHSRCRVDFMSHLGTAQKSIRHRQRPQCTSQARQEALWEAAAASLPDPRHRLACYEDRRRQLFQSVEQQASHSTATGATNNTSHAAWTSAWDELRKTLQAP